VPWYNEKLDYDLEEEEVDRRKINGGKFLDLGTGPATQAILLAKRGFKVVGSDLSGSAINRAGNVYANEKNVNFIVDDILNSNLKENEFEIELLQFISWEESVIYLLLLLHQFFQGLTQILFKAIVDGFVDETRSTPKVTIIILELAYLS
jgi:SAM-dependent methyltransferase